MHPEKTQLLEGLETARSEYHKNLQQEQGRPDPRLAVVARLTHALGRVYLFLGKPTTADPFLLQAAAAAQEKLEQARSTDLPANLKQAGKHYEWGNQVLAVALKQWWADLPNTTATFQEAQAIFAQGIQTDTDEYSVERAHLGLMYSHIFLEGYDQARAAGQTYLHLAQASPIPHPDLYIFETVLVVIDALEQGTPAAYQQAIDALEVCFVREDRKLWWSNQPPHVDVYELVQRKLRAAASSEE